MSLLWAVPPVAVVIAALIVLGHLRALAGIAVDLSIQIERLDEVRIAVAEVRSASADARASLRTLGRR
jgi:hypothetical protein